MVHVITAMFEHGVLKPSEPLKLPPHSRVRLAVELLEEDAEQARRQSAWEMVEQLWQRSAINSQGERPSRAQLHERR